MRISIVPKFRSTFFDAVEYDMQEDELIINYELPKELIECIRNPPKAVMNKNGDMGNQPDWINTNSVYLVIKKEK